MTATTSGVRILTRFMQLTLAVFLTALCVRALAADDNSTSDWTPPPMPGATPFAEVNLSDEQVAMLREKWGVEIIGLRLASANYMMDFRFRVLDVEKSISLFDHRIKPYVIADKSDIKLPVPMAAKVGAFRPTNRGKNIKPDKNYYMIFGNPDRHVKAGETVTIVIGDFRIDHLLVN